MIRNKERLIMESFTLDENFKDIKTQLVKLIYLEEYVHANTKVGGVKESSLVLLGQRFNF